MHDQLRCCDQCWDARAFLLHQRPARAAEHPHRHPNRLRALCARPGQQWAQRGYFGGAQQELCTGCLVLQLRRRRTPPLSVSRTSSPSSPGFSLFLYWKRSIHQPINYQHLTRAARQPAGYFESHCPLRQITRG